MADDLLRDADSQSAADAGGESEPLWSPPQISMLGLMGMMTFAAAALAALRFAGAGGSLVVVAYVMTLGITFTATEQRPRSARIKAVLLETIVFTLLFLLVLYAKSRHSL